MKAYVIGIQLHVCLFLKIYIPVNFHSSRRETLTKCLWPIFYWILFDEPQTLTICTDSSSNNLNVNLSSDNYDFFDRPLIQSRKVPVSQILSCESHVCLTRNFIYSVIEHHTHYTPRFPTVHNTLQSCWKNKLPLPKITLVTDKTNLGDPTPGNKLGFLRKHSTDDKSRGIRVKCKDIFLLVTMSTFYLCYASFNNYKNHPTVYSRCEQLVCLWGRYWHMLGISFHHIFKFICKG